MQVCADVSDAELAAWYRRARVAVVPLRCGAGVKLKTVEALREGVPLVVRPPVSMVTAPVASAAPASARQTLPTRLSRACSDEARHTHPP